MFPSTPVRALLGTKGKDVPPSARAEQAEDVNLSVEVSPVQVSF